ncbi:MAG: YHS domain-containing protein [Caldisericia bacterium]
MKHIDPVCGMVVKEEGSLKYEYKDKIYYFCSEICLDKFKIDPEKYLDINYKKEMKKE